MVEESPTGKMSVMRTTELGARADGGMLLPFQLRQGGGSSADASPESGTRELTCGQDVLISRGAFSWQALSGEVGVEKFPHLL